MLQEKQENARQVIYIYIYRCAELTVIATGLKPVMNVFNILNRCRFWRCNSFYYMPGSIPKDKYININTISCDIDNCVNEFFSCRNIDLLDVQQCRNIPHNILTLCLMNIYNNLFKPDVTLCNNQKSLIDYDNIELLTVIANKYIELALTFNKSIGIMQFSIMTGIHWQTLADWQRNKELNPLRSAIVENIREYHKMEQINLLNDTPVGALAVANNDHETGLEWSKNQLQQIAQNAVYLLPSERVDRLRLDKPE